MVKKKIGAGGGVLNPNTCDPKEEIELLFSPKSDKICPGGGGHTS